MVDYDGIDLNNTGFRTNVNKPVDLKQQPVANTGALASIPAPYKGLRVLVESLTLFYYYTGSAWAPEPASGQSVVEVANFAALPGTGVANTIYITLDNDNLYRWGGTTYVGPLNGTPLTADQLAALEGTGTPSAADPYVNDSDPRLAAINARNSPVFVQHNDLSVEGFDNLEDAFDALAGGEQESLVLNGGGGDGGGLTLSTNTSKDANVQGNNNIIVISSGITLEMPGSRVCNTRFFGAGTLKTGQMYGGAVECSAFYPYGILDGVTIGPSVTVVGEASGSITLRGATIISPAQIAAFIAGAGPGSVVDERPNLTRDGDDVVLSQGGVETSRVTAPASGGGGGRITALTGDVTASGTGSVAATIANDAVTYAKMQNVSATDKLLGRSSSGAGVVQEIDCTAFARTILDDAGASDVRTTLGLGTLATQSGTFSGDSSGTNTGDQNIFSGIIVSGQTTVTPNSTTTGLTLVAGSNITITTDNSTKTVTITASGGGTEATQSEMRAGTSTTAMVTPRRHTEELNERTANAFVTITPSSGVSTLAAGSTHGRGKTLGINELRYYTNVSATSGYGTATVAGVGASQTILDVQLATSTNNGMADGQQLVYVVENTTGVDFFIQLPNSSTTHRYLMGSDRHVRVVASGVTIITCQRISSSLYLWGGGRVLG